MNRETKATLAWLALIIFFFFGAPLIFHVVGWWWDTVDAWFKPDLLNCIAP